MFWLLFAVGGLESHLLRAGEPIDAVLEVQGVVKGASSEEVTKLFVFIVPVEPARLYEMKVASVAKDGNFAFPSVPPGSYEVRAIKDSNVIARRRVTIRQGEEAPKIELDVATGSIKGKLSISGAAKTAKIRIIIVDSTTRISYRCTSTSDGTYEISQIVSGDYKIIFLDLSNRNILLVPTAPVRDIEVLGSEISRNYELSPIPATQPATLPATLGGERDRSTLFTPAN